MISRTIRILILIALMATCLFVAAPVRAQEPEPVYLYPDFGLTFHVRPDRPIIIIWGWLSHTRGQNIEFLKAETSFYQLVDAGGNVIWSMTEAAAETYWTQPAKVDALECCGLISPNGSMWVSWWQYPLGTLSTGTYTFTQVFTLRHPVNDGYHVMHDATTGERMLPIPDIYRPGVTIGQMTIIVE